MLLPIANGSDTSPRRRASRWFLVALLSVEFIAAPAFGQATSPADKPASDVPAADKPAAGKPAADKPATDSTNPADKTAADKPVAASTAGSEAAGNAAQGTPKNSEAEPEAEPDGPLELSMLSVPGSPRPAVLGIAPEAPNVPATIGGRAASFGAPGPAGSDWSFRLGGRIAGFESFGIGQKPTPTPLGYSGTPLHVPALVAGRGGIWSGAGLTLLMTYGNPTISANVGYFVNLNGQEYRGAYGPQSGPLAGQAYIALNPPKFGNLQLSAKVGAFTETYGGVGQWGWGIMGPLLGLRGYGEVITGEMPLSTNLRFWFAHGFSAVPGIAENLIRGDYTGWLEPAISSIVHHAHVGINYRNNHGLKLHYARVYGVDEREVLNGTVPQRDGHMDIYLADLRTRQDQFGHFAIAGAYYDVKNGKNIQDGIWWGIDWTQGAVTQVQKFIGDKNTGTGSYAAVSAQWDFSLARMMWAPRNFDGRHPDIRGGIAGIYHATVRTDDPTYHGANGYTFAAEMEYVLTSFMGVFFRSYVESRDVRKYGWAYNAGANQLTSTDSLERFETKALMPGLIFRSDWASTDSIQIAYQRRFYNSVSDPNPAVPMDHNIITVGATASF